MGRAKLLEAAHGAVAPLYSPMILFDYVVFVLTGAMLNVLAEFLGDGLGVAGMAVRGDLLGLDLGDRPGGAEEHLGRGHIDQIHMSRESFHLESQPKTCVYR